MRIAITGTPGVGKSTLAHMAGERFGWPCTGVLELAQAHGLVVGHDAEDAADVLDIDRLYEEMQKADDANPARGIEILDGHLSHLLPVDAVWLIRCDPFVLEGRLRARGYKESKIQENLEAEAMDLVLQEAAEEDLVVVQRDGTRRSPEELLSSFVNKKGNPLNTTDLEPIDWSAWLLR